MEIQIRIIHKDSSADIHLSNKSFPLFGRMIPCYDGKNWSYTTEINNTVTSMCFPDENYDYEAMSANSTFIGAYDNGNCVGLAIMQEGFLKYMYLYDLKVDPAYRRQGVGTLLIEKAKSLATGAGYKGIYTIGQDNNLGACLFYIQNGFRIGGLDTQVYNGTSQEGKADIYFYLDLDP